jgi:hypothetical protein
MKWNCPDKSSGCILKFRSASATDEDPSWSTGEAMSDRIWSSSVGEPDALKVDRRRWPTLPRTVADGAPARTPRQTWTPCGGQW